MKTKGFLFTAACIASAIVAAAQPTILANKAFGGTWYDYASQVQATPDGGMIAIGTALSVDGSVVGSHGNGDAFVVKLDAAGNVDWKKPFGGTEFDGGNTIAPTADGGYIIGGISQSNDFDVPSTNTLDNNYWILKIDATGNVQWKKTYGGSSFEQLNTIIQLSDGTYLAAGHTRSIDGDVTINHGLDDCWLVKLDTAGNLQWQKTYGGTGYENLSKLVATNDGGFAFTALTSSNDGDVIGNHGGYDVWMVKLDVAGTIQWQRCYGGTGYEYSTGLMQTPTGEYVFLANQASLDGDGAFTDTTDIGGCWVVKISNTGNLLWENQYGGTGYEFTASLTTDSTGRYVIAASSSSNDGNVTGHHGTSSKKDLWVFCLDTAGVLNWQRSFGGIDDEDARSVVRLNDGSLAVLSDTYSNNNGDVFGSGYHWGTETVHPPNSPAFTVNTGDYWVIKISSPVGSPAGITEQNAGPALQLSPNPASASFTIEAENMLEVQVNDLAGRIIYNNVANGTLVEKTISVYDWTPGIYLVTVRTVEGIATKKLVVSGE